MPPSFFFFLFFLLNFPIFLGFKRVLPRRVPELVFQRCYETHLQASERKPIILHAFKKKKSLQTFRVKKMYFELSYKKKRDTWRRIVATQKILFYFFLFFFFPSPPARRMV